MIMEIKGKVHCFFEQSGTFKNEFIKLGIPAEDYDIQNNFGETDHVTDLFKKPTMTRTVNGLSGHRGSLCDEDRSIISPDYARNFICDCILGKAQKYTQLDLFENYDTK